MPSSYGGWVSSHRAKTDKHHVWWPKGRYRTQLERDFRNLCIFVVRMRVVDHERVHLNQTPPPKAPRLLMLYVVTEHVKMCQRCRRKLQTRTYLQEVA